MDNFGAFVQSRLDAGLRSRALAQAIRQEHSRRGIGKSRVRGQGPAPASERAQAGRGGQGGQGGQGKAAGDTTKGQSKGKGKGRP